MHWLALQHRLRRLRDEYFDSRKLSKARILSARSSDTGDAASRVDAAVRDLAYGKLLHQLSEAEKDILGIRLYWACLLAARESMRPVDKEEAPEPGDLEVVLIHLWNKHGRTQWGYWMHSAQSTEEVQQLGQFQSPSSPPPLP